MRITHKDLLLSFLICTLVQNYTAVCLQKQLVSTDKTTQFQFLCFSFFLVCHLLVNMNIR